MMFMSMVRLSSMAYSCWAGAGADAGGVGAVGNLNRGGGVMVTD